jgi:polar amino acid transport system substrate-binding protein
VTNATPARANDVAFSAPVLSIELGYLVPANSPIARAEDIDRPGIRIGHQGQHVRTHAACEIHERDNRSGRKRQAGDRHVRSWRDRRLCDQQADTIRDVGFHAGRPRPGRQLGLEHMAIAIPKGREDARPFVETFVRDAQSSGLLDEIEKQAGLRGAVNAKTE